MTVYFGIYEVKNMLNGKSYIGQSAVNVHGRCNKHIVGLKHNSDNIHLVNAVNKYGIENFSFKAILYCEEFELTRYEDGMINCDRPNRYNIREAADSNKGLKRSDESKHKMSESHKGKKASEEQRHKMSLARIGRASPNKGKKLSEETKHKLSMAFIGNTYTKGHKLSEEHKHKISLSNIGKKRTEESKCKMKGKPAWNRGKSSWNKGIAASDEAKRKMSEAHIGKSSFNKGKKLSEEHKLNLCKAWEQRRLVGVSEETKQKLSLIQQKRWYAKRSQVSESIDK